MNGPAVTRTELINKINEIIGLPLGDVPEKILAILGFTREMLLRLRLLQESVASLPTSITDMEDALWISEIADLVENLLPPEDK